MSKIACLHCDLLVNSVDISEGESALCPRCHQTIYFDQQTFTTSLALLVTALLVYFPAILLPFITMETLGKVQEVSLLTSVMAIAHDEMLLLATTVFLLVIAIPLIKMLGLLSIMIPLSRECLPFFGMTVTRYLLSTSPWSMVEVYLVGVLISLIKLTGMASIEFSGGFYAFIMLIITNALISVKLPQKRIWQTISQFKAMTLNASTLPQKTGINS